MANSYIDKYKGSDGRLSVYDILQKVGTTEYKNGTERQFEAVGIDYVKIDGNKFTNYGAYQFIWEKTFVKSPERSSAGVIENLNSYATFLTPHLIMDFSVLSIEDYRKIMLLHYSANEFVVECYDPIYNRKITVKMYFATEEMAKLYTIAQNRLLSDGQWEEWVDLVGVTEYKVELIGTNSDLDLVSVRYFVNAPTQSIDGVTSTLTPDSATDGGEKDVYMGEDVILGSNTNIPQETFASRKKFKNWNTEADGSGLTFLNGYAYAINKNLYLYAQWESTENHILSFNYGIANPTIIDGKYLTSRTVVKGQSIGELPTFTTPSVTLDGKEYKPYENGGWYFTPIKAENSMPIPDYDYYWEDRDDTIYLLFDRKKYRLTLMDILTEISTNQVEYNAVINLPNLVSNTHKVEGWYTTQNYQDGTKFTDTTMPPYNLTLFARWVEK